MQNKDRGIFKKCYVYSGNCISSYSGNHLEDYFKYRGWVVKQHLKFFHLDSVNWLGSTKTALISICIVAVWKNVGYFLVIYYAGIMGISKDLYEAAKVDGATSIQQFFKITLTDVKTDHLSCSDTWIIWSFQVFDLAYLMTGGGPGRATVTLVMGIYNAAN